jgi:hypothetical protein
MTAHHTAAHTDRLRQSGGKRTSVNLTAQALEDIAEIRKRWPDAASDSEVICAALYCLLHQLGRATR